MMCACLKFLIGRRSLIKALCILFAVSVTCAEANDIIGIKASQTKDYTRIIIETEDVPKYSYRNGSESWSILTPTSNRRMNF